MTQKKVYKYGGQTLTEQQLIEEIRAIESDYQDWIKRHDGNYQGDYWD